MGSGRVVQPFGFTLTDPSRRLSRARRGGRWRSSAALITSCGNLRAKAPAHLREELAEDYRRMVYADSCEAVEHERTRFVRKWRLHCEAVVTSLEEAGDKQFTFLQFPNRSGSPAHD